MSHQGLTGGVVAQNYRCVVVLGKARPITDPEEKAAALLKLTEHIIPGRTQHARAASDRELSQTSVLAIDLNEVSAKVSCLQHLSPLCGTWNLLQQIYFRPYASSRSNYSLSIEMGTAHSAKKIRSSKTHNVVDHGLELVPRGTHRLMLELSVMCSMPSEMTVLQN